MRKCRTSVSTKKSRERLIEGFLHMSTRKHLTNASTKSDYQLDERELCASERLLKNILRAYGRKSRTNVWSKIFLATSGRKGSYDGLLDNFMRAPGRRFLSSVSSKPSYKFLVENVLRASCRKCLTSVWTKIAYESLAENALRLFDVECLTNAWSKILSGGAQERGEAKQDLAKALR